MNRSNNPRKKLGRYLPDLIKNRAERKMPWNGITRTIARVISVIIGCMMEIKKPVPCVSNRLYIPDLIN